MKCRRGFSGRLSGTPRNTGPTFRVLIRSFLISGSLAIVPKSRPGLSRPSIREEVREYGLMDIQIWNTGPTFRVLIRSFLISGSLAIVPKSRPGLSRPSIREEVREYGLMDI